MKIVLTGSLGNIGKPLATELVQKGHTVTVISSNPERKKDIEALGATAAIGTVDDVDFLTAAFTNADTVYCMLPPGFHLSPDLDLIAYCIQIGNNYAQAIKRSGVKRVIHLSSIGAHLSSRSGLILGHYNVEQALMAIPGIALTHLRPTAFYYNLLAFVPVIKKDGHISSNYGGDDRIPWVSPIDIATVAAEEITAPMEGRKIRYIASDEPTCHEIAAILGAAIDKPEMKWNLISNEQMQQRLEAAGVPRGIAAGLTEMQDCMHKGILSEDYYRNRPAVLGKVKLTEYAREFAAAYNKK